MSSKDGLTSHFTCLVYVHYLRKL